MKNNNMVSVNLEIDADLLEQMKEILAPSGLTPEVAAEKFIRYCADPSNREHAIALLKKWKAEQEAN